MKEQNESQSIGVVISFRPALAPPHLDVGETNSLNKASSEIIAKLSNKAKVGVNQKTQPPSKITPLGLGGENVIYLNSTSQQNRYQNRKNNKTKNNQNKGESHGLHKLFE